MSTASDTDLIFAGGGAMGRVMAAHDWAATPVGPPEHWPEALRGVVRILLTSRFSMWMAWGPDLAMFYNEAYRRDTLRSKHPWALGRPAREVWAEIWHDIGPRIRSVLDTGEATWDEGLLLVLERSGYPEETYHTFSYSPLADEAGAVAGMLCVVSEETERVIGERRLRVLSELGDVSAVTAPTVEEAGRAVVAVLERGRADVPFSSLHLIDDDGPGPARLVAFHGTADDPRIVPALVRRDGPGGEVLPEALHAALESRRPQVLTGLAASHAGLLTPVRHFAGERLPDSAVVLPLAGAGGGHPLGVLVAGISPLRALDTEYRRFLDLVAGQVGTAVADARALAHQRRRADELAELDRAKTEFFTGVSHELRTPLTLIAGPAEDALADLDEPLAPVQRNRLEIIRRNSGRLRRLVDTMLEFSRLEGGHAVPRPTAVDLAELTRSIGNSFAPAVTRAGLDFAITCPPLPAAVSVDVDMWEKVVLNLLSNAVKYTLEGRVELAVAPDPDTGGMRLTVTDTGIGVPEVDRPLLFERFHRVPNATGRSHEGTGIGLALVAELVALHDGTVTVRSALGTGSTFTVTLPASAYAAEADPVLAHHSTTAQLYRDEALQWSGGGSDPAAGVDVGPTAGATVLVAEDNPDLRRFLAGLLEPHYRVLLVADGAVALERARTERPDLVLTDIMMPGLDGFGLLAALRAHPTTATTPVVMLSARAGEEAAIEGLAAGADDYLVKPFSSADLLARVRSNLQLARVRNHESAWRTALVNAIQDGLFVLDAEGRVVETNAAFHAILGYGPEGLPFVPPHPWWPDAAHDPDAAERVHRAFAEMQAGPGGRFVLPMDHRAGHRLWIEVLIDTVAGRAERLLVGTLRDITGRQRIADRDKLLAETGRLLALPGPVGERLDELVRAAVPVLGGLVAVLLAGPEGQAPIAVHHPDPQRVRAVRTMGPVQLHPDLRERYAAGAAFVAPPGTCAVAAAAGRQVGLHPGPSVLVPLHVGGRVIGTLVVCDTPQPPDETDVDIAEELGRRITLAVESRRLADRERRLHQLTAALAAAGSVSAAARVLVAGIQEVTGAVAGMAFLRRPGQKLEPVHSAGDAALLLAAPAEECVDLAAPVWPGPEDRVALLPLPVGERVVGALAIAFPAPRTVDDDERSFLRTLAGEAGSAFERAALADARRELAETLQRSLLPPELPAHERLTLAARYQPAASGSRTGGDWYDVLALDEHRVAIVVGDVVGQGPAAAAVMGQLRSALSAYLLQADGPAQALAWLDRYSRRVPGARGSTAICVVLDTVDGRLRWARAGHPPPLVVGIGSGTRYLSDATGTVLGVRGAPPFTEGTATIAPGDTVVLYTDGLVERRGEVVDNGLERLAAAATGVLGPVGRLAPALVEAALLGAGPADDVALVLARLRPAPLLGDRPARPEELAGVRRDVRAWARAAALPEELAEDLQLAVGEAVANAVEHAYAAREPGRVRYRLDQDADGGVRVHVEDDGIWRPPREAGYRGHGLVVIDGVGRALDLEKAVEGTRLRFTLPPEADG